MRPSDDSMAVLLGCDGDGDEAAADMDAGPGSSVETTAIMVVLCTTMHCTALHSRFHRYGQRIGIGYSTLCRVRQKPFLFIFALRLQSRSDLVLHTCGRRREAVQRHKCAGGGGHTSTVRCAAKNAFRAMIFRTSFKSDLKQDRKLIKIYASRINN